MLGILFCAVLLRIASLTSSYIWDAFSPEVPYRQMKTAALFLEEENPKCCVGFCFIVGVFLRNEFFLNGTVGIKEYSGICQMSLDDKPNCKTKCSSS